MMAPIDLPTNEFGSYACLLTIGLGIEWHELRYYMPAPGNNKFLAPFRTSDKAQKVRS